MGEYEEHFWNDGNILKLNDGDNSPSVNLLKLTELQTYMVSVMVL